MFRRIIAGTAVAGALTFGIAGIAGASTGATGNTGTSHVQITPSTTVCSLLPQIQTRVQKAEGRLATVVSKAQARETKAKDAGHTKLADAIAKRITRVQDREAKVNARLSKLSADCSTNG